MSLWLLAACATDGPVPADTATAGDSAEPACEERDWYADADHDGWGGTATSACEPPAGHVERGGDCDDADRDTFPGALDGPDGVDQDCDGTIDDAAAELILDPGAPTHAWFGLGAHVWVWDELWPAVLDTLHGRVIRSSLYSLEDPDSAPAGGSAADFDAWLVTHDTAHADAVRTVTTAHDAGLAVIALVWESPPAWETGGALNEAHLTDHARLTAAIVARLAEAGARPEQVELFNEPDGDWNTYVSPGLYARVVAETRAELDARGLTDVAILGPGLAFAQSTDVWASRLDPAELGGVSTHLWDDAYAEGDGVALTADALATFAAAADRLDPGRVLPRVVTEAGSKDTAVHGVPTAGADTCGDYPDQPEYAVRLTAYTLLSAASGAAAVLPWQAVDPDWGGCWGTWGLVDLHGTPRPALDVLAHLASSVPEGARVVPTRWPDPDLAAVGFVTDDTLVLALANPTAGDVTRTVGLAGSAAWTLGSDVADTTPSVRVRDPLDDGRGFSVSGSVWIDTANTGYFAGDAGRLTANDDAVVTWSFGAAVTRVEAALWVWGGVGSVTMAASVDGETWTELTPLASTPTAGDWALDRLVYDTVPAGTREVRLTFDPRAVAWTPQLGELVVTLAPAAPTTTDDLAASRTLRVTVPAESTRVLTFGR